MATPAMMTALGCAVFRGTIPGCTAIRSVKPNRLTGMTPQPKFRRRRVARRRSASDHSLSMDSNFERRNPYMVHDSKEGTCHSLCRIITQLGKRGRASSLCPHSLPRRCNSEYS